VIGQSSPFVSSASTPIHQSCPPAHRWDPRVPGIPSPNHLVDAARCAGVAISTEGYSWIEIINSDLVAQVRGKGRRGTWNMDSDQQAHSFRLLRSFMWSRTSSLLGAKVLVCFALYLKDTEGYFLESRETLSQNVVVGLLLQQGRFEVSPFSNTAAAQFTLHLAKWEVETFFLGNFVVICF
jgi:hypothetical protein